MFWIVSLNLFCFSSWWWGWCCCCMWLPWHSSPPTSHCASWSESQLTLNAENFYHMLSFDSLFNYLGSNISFYKTSWTNVSSIHSISQFLLIFTFVYFENSVLLGTIFILLFLQSNTSDPILLKCLNTWPRLLNFIQTLLLNKTDHFQENRPF